AHPRRDRSAHVPARGSHRRDRVVGAGGHTRPLLGVLHCAPHGPRPALGGGRVGRGDRGGHAVSRSRVIHSARLISGGVITENAWVRSAGGTVTGVGVGETWAPADEIINAAEVAGAGAVLTPGFIDLHSHGGGGASHEEGAEAIRTARALHTAHGTTRAVISLVTAPREDTARRVAEIAALSRTDPGILGSH